MHDTAILFPEGSEFFDVEGVPVVLTRPPGRLPFATAYDPGKPPRPFPFESVMRNGSPISETKFRAYADLPTTPAHTREAAGDDGVPILLDSDPVDWDTAAAADARRLAAIAIARAARH